MRISLKTVPGISGYSNIGRYLARALALGGHEICWPTVFGIMSRPIDVTVHVTSPGYQRNPRRLNLAYTMFETDRLPPGWADALNRCDGVLIPSEWCRAAFLASGVTVPIHVVNHGVFTCDVPAPGPRARVIDPFCFLSVLQWTERKNPAALLEAYWLEFAQDEPVSLGLKVSPWGIDDTIAAEIAAVRARLGLRAYASLEVIRGDMHQAEVWELINSCHAYVSAHCAEGFGSPMLEAMACGKPVIGTGYSGNLEFMNDTNSLLVDYTLGLVGEVRPALRQFYSPNMTWAQVSIPDLRCAMRLVYEGGALVQGMADNARLTVAERFTPQNTAAQFGAAIERIRSHATG